MVYVNRNFYCEGVDLFDESIKKSKKEKIHNKYKIGDSRKLNSLYKANSFDVAVIEHFKKREALKLIKDIERIARKRVIIMTPNGFYPQDSINGNPYQRHSSGWTDNEMKNLGYKVFGLRGYKYLRGDYATIKFKPWVLWGALSFMSEFLFFFFPKNSYHIFCIKDTEYEK